jgi:hypothetical protein
MDQTTSTFTNTESNPTQHAMLIVWGHFARDIGLLERLSQVPIDQKTVRRAPQEKLVEFLLGLLAGIEYLADLSAGAPPVVNDPEVATVWKLRTLADTSGVSRTLGACDDKTVAALSAVLDAVGQPFLDRAVSDLRQRHATLLLDADLTGRPVGATSQTFPGAAFGYMDGEVRLGYQLVQICLQTELFGRQWLSAQHHPGNTVSATCLGQLLQEAERRLGGHPRRRVELVQQRLRRCEAQIAAGQAGLTSDRARLAAQAPRVQRLTEQIRQAEVQLEAWRAAPLSARQTGPRSKLTQVQHQLGSWRHQLARAQTRLAQVQTVAERRHQRQQAQAEADRAERDRLHERYERFCQENSDPAYLLPCRIRLDAGFASGENLTELLELGYDVDTKSANPAVVQALRHRVTAEQAWTPVGKNAEMIGWTDYTLHTCPYPLTVGLERFHTPQGVRYAVLIGYQDVPPRGGLDLRQWFHDYNGRQTIEAGNKEEKTTFKVQHLMSRSPAGIRIQALLTVFAANFVRWADEWIRPRVERSTRRFDTTLASPKRLVRIAANSPATVERANGRELVCFSPLSSFGGVVIRLAGVASWQLPLPLFANDHFSSA